MSDKINTGNLGENLAAKFLSEKGFRIVARNYRFGRGEIDLIVRRDDWTIFVEVKSRTSTAFGEPEEFVDHSKARRIIVAAEEFIFRTDWRGHIRFDIVSVKLTTPPQIDHFEDAFY